MILLLEINYGSFFQHLKHTMEVFSACKIIRN